GGGVHIFFFFSILYTPAGPGILSPRRRRPPPALFFQKKRYSGRYRHYKTLQSEIDNADRWGD
ncbi:hypothetical protein, partial [Pyramidobacter sp. CG50-2]|uniref:hypothetical protein n=1 Tax=Pyramidobacter sp. CG50-2 TaxID=2382160 RepID=UPI001F3143E6